MSNVNMVLSELFTETASAAQRHADQLAKEKDSPPGVLDMDLCPDCGMQPGGHGMCVTCCEGWDEYRTR